MNIIEEHLYDVDGFAKRLWMGAQKAVYLNNFITAVSFMLTWCVPSDERDDDALVGPALQWVEDEPPAHRHSGRKSKSILRDV